MKSGKKAVILLAFCLLQIVGHAQINQQLRQKRYEVLPTRKEGTSLLFVGNSITDDCEWGELFENPNVLSRGIDGNTTGTVLTRTHELTRHKPSKVFFGIGTNDLGRTPIDTVMLNMTKILQLFAQESPDTKVYIQSVLPVGQNSMWGPGDKNDDILALNERYKQFCKENNYTYIDLHSHFLGDDGYYLNPIYTNDGLHIMGEGFLLWKSLIIDYVNE